MILDTHQIDTAQPLQTGICIVGAGAAGITLACELDGTDIPVLLIDAGPVMGKAEASQDPYEGETEGAHPPPRFFRRRGFGGTTAIWGGRCVPYDPIDFEARDYVANSGWPIGYDEVARHYPKAMAYCDAGSFEFDARRAFSQIRDTVAGMASGGGICTELIERYSLPTHFGNRYRDRLAASRNVRVLGDAQALRLLRQGERVGALEARLQTDGPVVRIEASHFVLAMGGIETARLLLVSDRENGGLGNRYDNVGRYYTCHVENSVGTLRPRHPGTAFDFETTRDGVYARRKLTIDSDTQRRERLLNISFRLHYPDVSNAAHRSAVLSSVFLAKRALIPEYRRILQHGHQGDAAAVTSMGAHLRNVALGLPQLVGFSVDWLQRRILAERKLPYVLIPNADGSFVLEFNAEQTPLRDSRITLANAKDHYGVPRVQVQWRLAEEDVDSICRAYRLLRDHVQHSGAGALEFNDAQLHSIIAASQPLGGHHIGTVRMASDPRYGVVDTNAALFDAQNVYVASAATFPTSSHANPTLTIVAMTIRLAQSLRSLHKRGSAM